MVHIKKKKILKKKETINLQTPIPWKTDVTIATTKKQMWKHIMGVKPKENRLLFPS